MPRFREDFSDTPEQQGYTVPSGTYEAEVQGVEYYAAKSDDKFPGFNWKFKIVNHDTEEGKIVYGNTSLSPKAKPFHRAALRAVFQQPITDSFEWDPEDTEGMPCRVRVVQNTFDNKTKPKVSNILPPIGGYDFSPTGDTPADALAAVAAVDPAAPRRPKGTVGGKPPASLFDND